MATAFSQSPHPIMEAKENGVNSVKSSFTPGLDDVLGEIGAHPSPSHHQQQLHNHHEPTTRPPPAKVRIKKLKTNNSNTNNKSTEKVEKPARDRKRRSHAKSKSSTSENGLKNKKDGDDPDATTDTAGGQRGKKRKQFMRRNIRSVMQDSEVNAETRAAQEAESVRLQRVKERDEQLRMEYEMKQMEFLAQPVGTTTAAASDTVATTTAAATLTNENSTSIDFANDPFNMFYPSPPPPFTNVTTPLLMQQQDFQTTMPGTAGGLSTIVDPFLISSSLSSFPAQPTATTIAGAGTAVTSNNINFRHPDQAPFVDNNYLSGNYTNPFNSMSLPFHRQSLSSTLDQKKTFLPGVSACQPPTPSPPPPLADLMNLDFDSHVDPSSSSLYHHHHLPPPLPPPPSATTTALTTATTTSTSVYYPRISETIHPPLAATTTSVAPPPFLPIATVKAMPPPLSASSSSLTHLLAPVEENDHWAVAGTCKATAILLTSDEEESEMEQGNHNNNSLLMTGGISQDEVIELSGDSEDEEDLPMDTIKSLAECGLSCQAAALRDSPEIRAAVLAECKEDRFHRPDSLGRVLINRNHSSQDSDVFLNSKLAALLKPHQIGGIRFLYDNVVECFDNFQNTPGFGCILAHSMGLGKTVQVVSFLDVLFRSVPGARTCLLIVPINTLMNWQSEFHHWLPEEKTETESASVLPPPPAPPSSQQTPPSLPVHHSHHQPTPSLSSSSTTATSTTTTAASTYSTSSSSTSRPFSLFILKDNARNLISRHRIIKEWNEKGGVLLMGYEMFRLLVNRRNNKASSSSAAINNIDSSFRNKTMSNLDSSTSSLQQHSHSETMLAELEEEERKESIWKDLQYALVQPGPQVVICDEGHRIKNSEASISKALKRMATRRRVVLTGYPLQNNLLEYWCMVDFVRPNYLGSRNEFTNMFQRPIENGQCVDSTFDDRKIMQGRAHVLHELLSGFVLRRSHAVLKGTLPSQKMEYVLCVRLSSWQRRLYRAFMSALRGEEPDYMEEQHQLQQQQQQPTSILSAALSSTSTFSADTFAASFSDSKSAPGSVTTTIPIVETTNTLKTYAVCCKIWNHPDILYHAVFNHQNKPTESDIDFDVEELIDSLTVDAGTNEAIHHGMQPPLELPRAMVNNNNNNNKRRQSRAKNNNNNFLRSQSMISMAAANGQGGNVEDFGIRTNNMRSSTLNGINYDWAQIDNLWQNYILSDLQNSGKMVILMSLLDKSVLLGDKMLVFSQSLLTLNMIEHFLSKRYLPQLQETWCKNVNYFRLDGSTSANERDKQINQFNAPNSPFKLFLLSTRAGCLGINLVSANRVVVMDASWNPCHDCQAVCRVYRYGQVKPCFIYRLIADNSMEKKIYDRQVTKQGMADRVVDEMNPDNHFTRQQVDDLFEFKDEDSSDNNNGLSTVLEEFTNQSTDCLLNEVLRENSQWITKKPFTHESLLIDRKDIRLTKTEKREAKKRYESDKIMSRIGQPRQSYTNYYSNDSNSIQAILDPRNREALLAAARNDPTDLHYQRIMNVLSNATNAKLTPSLSSTSSSLQASCRLAAEQLRMDLEEQRQQQRKNKLNAFYREMQGARSTNSFLDVPRPKYQPSDVTLSSLLSSNPPTLNANFNSSITPSLRGRPPGSGSLSSSALLAFNALPSSSSSAAATGINNGNNSNNNATTSSTTNNINNTASQVYGDKGCKVNKLTLSTDLFFPIPSSEIGGVSSSSSHSDRVRKVCAGEIVEVIESPQRGKFIRVPSTGEMYAVRGGGGSGGGGGSNNNHHHNNHGNHQSTRSSTSFINTPTYHYTGISPSPYSTASNNSSSNNNNNVVTMSTASSNNSSTINNLSTINSNSSQNFVNDNNTSASKS